MKILYGTVPSQGVTANDEMGVKAPKQMKMNEIKLLACSAEHCTSWCEISVIHLLSR